MPKVYDNFHIFYFQKRMVSAETVSIDTVFIAVLCRQAQWKNQQVQTDKLQRTFLKDRA